MSSCLRRTQFINTSGEKKEYYLLFASITKTKISHFIIPVESDKAVISSDGSMTVFKSPQIIIGQLERRESYERVTFHLFYLLGYY